MDTKEIARLLGQRGGQARAKSLTASQRKNIASKASRKRWGMLTAKHTTQATEEDQITIGNCKYCGLSDWLCQRRKRNHTFTPYQG